jgi:hypothetical protein
MPQDNLFLPPSGFTVLNITSQRVLKATNGQLRTLLVSAPGATSGAWAFNDCSTAAAVAASNLIWELAFGAATNIEGLIVTFNNIPFNNGLVISVPGGSPIASVWLA